MPEEAKYCIVANAIAQGVEDGCLAPGESLPTHRELAEALGVTIGTVSRGYAEAAQRGLTVGVTGRGTFVTAPCHDVDVYEGAGRMHDLGFIAPFEYLNPDLNEAVAELSRYADLKELSNYQQPRGLLRHREAGVHWAGRYGLAVSPENLLVCAGAQHALLTVLASLFNPGDRIARRATQLSAPQAACPPPAAQPDARPDGSGGDAARFAGSGLPGRGHQRAVSDAYLPEPHAGADSRVPPPGAGGDLPAL